MRFMGYFYRRGNPLTGSDIITTMIFGEDGIGDGPRVPNRSAMGGIPREAAVREFFDLSEKKHYFCQNLKTTFL